MNRRAIILGVPLSFVFLVVIGVVTPIIGEYFSDLQAAQELREGGYTDARVSFYQIFRRWRPEHVPGYKELEHIVAEAQSLDELSLAQSHIGFLRSPEFEDTNSTGRTQETYYQVFCFKWKRMLADRIARCNNWGEGRDLWLSYKPPSDQAEIYRELYPLIKQSDEAYEAIRFAPSDANDVCEVAAGIVGMHVHGADLEHTVALLYGEANRCPAYARNVTTWLDLQINKALRDGLTLKQAEAIDRLPYDLRQKYLPLVARAMSQHGSSAQELAWAYRNLPGGDPERESILIRWKVAAAGLIDTARTRPEAEIAWRLSPPGSEEEKRALAKLADLL